VIWSHRASREYAAALADEEPAAYAFIPAWMVDDVHKGMLLIEQHHVPQEAALFVLSLVKAARRVLLSAEGYQVEQALTVLDQRMEDAAKRAPDEPHAGAPRAGPSGGRAKPGEPDRG
jgi:hypothetical protein